MLPQRNFGVHANEPNMAAIVFPGTHGVKFLVIQFGQRIAPRCVLPDPFGKLISDCLLLLLCKDRFLFVQHPLLISVDILNGIKHTDVFEVQRFFDDLVGIYPFCPIGDIDRDIFIVGVFVLDIPDSCRFGIMYFYLVAGVIRRGQKVKYKLLNRLHGKPGCAKPHVDLAGSKVFRLDLLQCLHVHSECGVIGCAVFCNRQFLPDIVG